MSDLRWREGSRWETHRVFWIWHTVTSVGHTHQLSYNMGRTSYHFAIFLELWSQDATAVLAIPLYTLTHQAEGKSNPVSFKSEQCFPTALLSDFSLFLIGHNWVTCMCLLSWSVERRMWPWCWLKLGTIHLTHLGEEWPQEQNAGELKLWWPTSKGQIWHELHKQFLGKSGLFEYISLFFYFNIFLI